MILSKRNNTKLLISYILFMLCAVLLLILIGLNGIYLIESDKVKIIIKQNMLNIINSYDEKLNSTYETRNIDWLHKKYKCCGINDYRDWDKFMFSNNFNMTNLQKHANLSVTNFIKDIPDSCCLTSNYNCGKQYIKKLDLINSNGCFELFTLKFSNDLKILCKFSIIFSMLILFSLFTTIFVILLNTYDYLPLQK